MGEKEGIIWVSFLGACSRMHFTNALNSQVLVLNQPKYIYYLRIVTVYATDFRLWQNLLPYPLSILICHLSTVAASFHGSIVTYCPQEQAVPLPVLYKDFWSQYWSLF